MAGLALVAAGLTVGCGGAADGVESRGGGPDDDLPGEWAPPVTVAGTGGDVPTTAVDPEGKVAYVAWTGGADEQANVHLVRIRPDGRVSDPVRVNDVPGDAAPHGQAPATVAVGPGGDVYVAWQTARAVEGRRFPASDLRFARSTDGGRSFEPAITVHADAEVPASHTFHDVRVARGGTVLVSWIDSRKKDAWIARSSGEHGERGASAGGAGGRSSKAPELQASPALEVRLARSEDGGRSFGRSTVVDSVPCPCCRTALTGRGDEVIVAWRKLFGKRRDVRDVVLARSEDGGRSFGKPLRVAVDGWSFPACPHAGPALAVDESGVTHVAWYTGKDGGTGLYYARADELDAAPAFHDPRPLATGADLVPSQASLAPGSDGLWIAWEERGRDGSGFRLLHAVAGERPVPERAGFHQSGSYPSLSAASGLRVLAWLEGDRIRARIGKAATGAATGAPAGS